VQGSIGCIAPGAPPAEAVRLSANLWGADADPCGERADWDGPRLCRHTDPESKGLRRRQTESDLSPTQENRFAISFSDSYRRHSMHSDDPFLLCPSHIVHTPHNYNPEHAYRTRSGVPRARWKFPALRRAPGISEADSVTLRLGAQVSAVVQRAVRGAGGAQAARTPGTPRGALLLPRARRRAALPRGRGGVVSPRTSRAAAGRGPAVAVGRRSRRPPGVGGWRCAEGGGRRDPSAARGAEAAGAAGRGAAGAAGGGAHAARARGEGRSAQSEPLRITRHNRHAGTTAPTGARARSRQLPRAPRRSAAERAGRRRGGRRCAGRRRSAG